MRSIVTGGNVLCATREPRSFCAWWVMTLAARDVFEYAGAARWLVLPDAPKREPSP